MSTLRRDGALAGGGAAPAEPGPASSAAPLSSGALPRRPAEGPGSSAGVGPGSSQGAGSGASSSAAAPTSERAPDSALEVDERDWLPTSGPRSGVPTTRRSPGGPTLPAGPVSERSPDSTLEIDEKDWLLVSPPLPRGPKAIPPRPAPTAPPRAAPTAAREPSFSRPTLSYELPPEGSELLHPGTDEVADSGVLSPASRRAPDPWATPSIVPPAPFTLASIAVTPGVQTPERLSPEAESSAADGAGAVAVKAPPRAEPRPLPRWVYAAVPLALAAAFGVNRLVSSAPVPAATPTVPVEMPALTQAAEPAARPPADAVPAVEPAESAAPVASEAPPPATAAAPPLAPTGEKAVRPDVPRPPAARPDDPAPKAPATAPRPPAASAAFDRDAAAGSLGGALANAQRCVPPGMGGVARVAVTFAPSGRVTQATVEGPPFAGTPAGGCIAMRARAASVPPFPGAAVTVHKSVRF